MLARSRRRLCSLGGSIATFSPMRSPSARRGLFWHCSFLAKNGAVPCRGIAGLASAPAGAPAQPLLRPPSESKEIAAMPVELCDDCGVDLNAPGVPTIAVIGPSRRGKSVLASLLAGGTPGTFKQSHSSFRAMTSGTHVCEVPLSGSTLPLRIIDTEGLSHVGRSRRNEALVRQFLISTYLTSSWILWLDTEVLSSSFFNTMWLVHDYVVDVLRVREASGRERLPGLVYIRTQETDVQRQEYAGEFPCFGSFFNDVLNEHEDAPILSQMFGSGRIHGQALPIWTMEDLQSYEAGSFWSSSHSSEFKTSVEELCGKLAHEGELTDSKLDEGPPLLALSSLATHLDKIARLEAFDPRDHEANKIGKLRAHLRSAYGDPLHSALWIADLFDPEDPEVKQQNGDLVRVARARLEKQCNALRLEVEVAETDPDVQQWWARFKEAAGIFQALLETFACESFHEKKVLLRAIHEFHLEPEPLSVALTADLMHAEMQFLAATGMPRESLEGIRLRTRLQWRFEDAVAQLRGCHVAKLPLRPQGGGKDFETKWVWRIGEWPGIGPGSTRSKVRRPEYALWTDGQSWRLYEEKVFRQRGSDDLVIGELRDVGTLGSEEGLLPLPEADAGFGETFDVSASARSMQESSAGHMV